MTGDILTLEQTEELLRRFRHGDRRERDTAMSTLIAHNMRLVHKEVRKVSSQYASTDDLLAAGTYGLFRAAQRVDPERAYGWFRIAQMEVRNALREELRRTGRGVSLSDRASRYAARVAAVRRGGAGTVAEVVEGAVAAGVPREAAEALAGWTSTGKVVSVDSPWVHVADLGRPADVDLDAAVESLPPRLREGLQSGRGAAHGEALDRLAHPSRAWRLT